MSILNLYRIDICLISFFNAYPISVFHNYWYLFVSYAILNLLEVIIDSLLHPNKKNTHHTFYKKIINKTGYWIVILIAFGFSGIFDTLGNSLMGIDLSVVYLIGWYTLGLLLINEVNDILNGLVSMGIKVPGILIKSIRLTKQILGKESKTLLEDYDTKKNKH